MNKTRLSLFFAAVAVLAFSFLPQANAKIPGEQQQGNQGQGAGDQQLGGLSK